MSEALPYILIAVFVIFSAYFSGSEIAFASVNRRRLQKRAEDGKKADRLALFIYDRFDRALITILIGNNLVNIGSSAVATVIATSLMGEKGAWIATAVITVIILVFGEITPKILASGKPAEFARFSALPLRVLMFVTAPFVFIFNKSLGFISRAWERYEDDDETITEDDLETIFDTVEDEGIVDEDVCDMLQNALDFSDVLAYEIITPRVDMVAVDADDPPEEQYRIIEQSHNSRLPIYRDTPDHIIGILNRNQWLLSVAADGDRDLAKAMSEPVFVHKTMPISDVLSIMKKEKKHLVIVTDEYGGTSGLLTMEDILEQLVGEIWDEHDDIEPEFECIAPDVYRAAGDMRLLDLFEELDIDDRNFDDDNATLGGWVTERLGDYAEVGDSFTYENLTVTVTEIEDHRVMSTRITVEELPEPEEE